MENEFSEWMVVKDRIHKGGAITKFSEGQIWWAALGKNVGVEINGKNKDFSRPVVILKKLSHQCFLRFRLHLNRIAAPGMQSLTLGVSKNMLFSPRYE